MSCGATLDVVRRSASRATRRDSGWPVRIAFALALTVFGAAYLRDWHLPGLYMDAINPEYLIPGIVDPPAPYDFALPGNRLGDRFPVLTSTVYHGSAQLYAALPFMAVFGADLTTFRFVQLLFGGAILALVLLLSASRAFGPKRAVAAGAAGVLALDPAFVLSLRTQAYSCMFPLLLLLGCVLLLRGWRGSRVPWLRLLVSGVLYGLAVFSYFIFAFFLPALLWLVLRTPDGDRMRRSWVAPLPWLAGCVIGYLPWIWGILLIRHELGGSSQLFDFLRQTREELQPGQDTEGLFGRIGTVFTESRRVFTGEWPWLMILGQQRTGLMESVKADLLVLVPLLALIPGLASAAQRRPIRPPLALALSFGCGALLFGSRLDGHHYTAVLPLLYAAFGCACAALWPWEAGAGWRTLVTSRGHAARGVLVIVAVTFIAITSVLAQQDFHRALQATGGVRLYSNAIDRFAQDLDRHSPNATVYTPDWGFALPVAFMSDAAPLRPVVDVAQIRQEACAGKPQLVVFEGSTNEARMQLIADLARRPIDDLRTWSQRDGVPVFQTARFAPSSQCDEEAAAAAAATRTAGISITPESMPACPFLAPVAIGNVSWSVPRAAGHGVEMFNQAPGGPETLLSRGGARGSNETGAGPLAGMRFFVRDAVTHEELASVTVEQTPCPVS